jgi:hypothetical protein
MAEKLMIDKNKGFGRNLSGSLRIALSESVKVLKQTIKIKPGYAGVQGEKRTRWYVTNTSVDHNR